VQRDPNALRVIHSIFDAEALVPVLRDGYDIGEIGECVLERSYANDVYRLTTTNGDRYYLKVYRRDWRAPSDVAWELRIQEHLIAGGAPVALPLTRRDGLDMTVLGAPEGDRAAVLYAQAPGSKPREPFTVELYTRFGQASAQLHAVLDTLIDASGRPADDIETLVMTPGRELLDLFDPAAHERHAIEAIMTRLAEEINLKSPDLDWGICHGDLTLDNITVTEDGTITFFDFDLAALSWRARDPCGVFAASRLIPGAGGFWDAFLGGYRSVRPFSDANQRAVPLMRAVNQWWDLGHDVSRWSRWSGQWRVAPNPVTARLTEIQRWIDAELS